MINKQVLEIDEHTDLTVKINTSEYSSLIPFEIGITRDIDTVSVSINAKQLAEIIYFLVGANCVYQSTMKGSTDG